MSKKSVSAVFDAMGHSPVAAPTAPTTQPVAAPTTDNAALLAEIERLKAENANLAKSKGTFKAGQITVAITDGRVSKDPKTGAERKTTVGRITMYGFQRMPITLSRSQWERVQKVLTGKELVHIRGTDADPIAYSDFIGEAAKRNLLAEKE